MSGIQVRPDWYREWFGEEYLALYPHRDQEEARAGVQLVLRTLGQPHGMILDLACGAGRHVLEFKVQAASAVGLDLSGPLLEAARLEDRALKLVRGDMRKLPFGDASFTLATNFFTSFGYFVSSDEDRRVLQEVRRVLEPSGCFALDFLNAERVRRGLIESDERELDGRRIIQNRRLEDGGRVVVKDINIVGPGSQRQRRVFQERVRLYSETELHGLLGDAGLRAEYRFGDYDGADYHVDSPRLILMGYAE